MVRVDFTLESRDHVAVEVHLKGHFHGDSTTQTLTPIGFDRRKLERPEVAAAIAQDLAQLPLPPWALGPEAHALAASAVVCNGGSKVEMHGMPGVATWDHRVGGKALFPGAGYLELCLAWARGALGHAASEEAGVVSKVVFGAPLVLGRPGEQTVVVCSGELASGRLTVRSGGGGGANVQGRWASAACGSPRASSGCAARRGSGRCRCHR